MILLAIEEHDNGWREWTRRRWSSPSSGRVFDFVDVPARHRQAVWPRGIARLAEERAAAALVAQHAITVYDRYSRRPSGAISS